MPSTLKRKNPAASEGTQEGESAKRRFTEASPSTAQTDDKDAPDAPPAATDPKDGPSADSDASTPSTSSAQQDRAARFAALRARNTSSRKANFSATQTEVQRLGTDPALLASLNRKRDRAAEKLLEVDTADGGEDYSRKRAWDWTAEESAAWDKKMGKKQRNRDNVAFQDFGAEANKVYKRQVREMKPDTESYERDKMVMIERAAASGGLEIVETEEGELIAVDRDGSFYSTKDTTSFVANKPSKDAIDKLVGEIRKAEEVRLKKRRDRAKGDDEGDVTYINDKNKQFNQKLARFYNKYTADIRESFERGTAI